VCFVKVSDAAPAVWYCNGFAVPEKLSVDEVARRLTVIMTPRRERSPWEEF